MGCCDTDTKSSVAFLGHERVVELRVVARFGRLFERVVVVMVKVRVAQRRYSRFRNLARSKMKMRECGLLLSLEFWNFGSCLLWTGSGLNTASKILNVSN